MNRKIILTVSQYVSWALASITDGDPEWDAKPEEWRLKTLERLRHRLAAAIENAVAAELAEFDQATLEDYRPSAGRGSLDHGAGGV